MPGRAMLEHAAPVRRDASGDRGRETGLFHTSGDRRRAASLSRMKHSRRSFEAERYGPRPRHLRREAGRPNLALVPAEQAA